MLVHDHELLGSEAREFARMEKTVSSGGIKLNAEPASAEERALIDQVLGSKEPVTELPAGWYGYETVVALRLLPPRDLRSGKRASEGRGDALIFRAPRVQPVLTVGVRAGKHRITTPGRDFKGKALGQWVLEHVAMRREAGE